MITSLTISSRSQMPSGKPAMPRKKKIVTKLYVWISRMIFDQNCDRRLSSFFSLIMYSIPAFYSI